MSDVIDRKAISVSGKLRQLANWLEAHEVEAIDVVNMSVDRWGDMTAQLKQRAVIRICGHEGIDLQTYNDRVHGVGSKDGVRVVFCT
jgi:hypothetical protein